MTSVRQSSRTARSAIIPAALSIAVAVLAGCSTSATTSDSSSQTSQGASGPSSAANSSTNQQSASSPPASTGGGPLSKITLAVSGAAPHLTQTTVYSVAQQLGYYKDEGLDLNVVFTDGSTAATQAVASGSADIADPGPEAVLSGITHGVPMKVIGGLVINWPWRIAVLPGSAVTDATALKGKTIGVISLSSGSYPYAQAFVDAAGIDPKAVSYVPVGVGAPALQALKSGKIDALALYTQAYTVIEQTGAKFTYLPNPDRFDGLQSLVFATSTSELKSDKATLAKFMRASYRALLFSAINPSAAVQLAYKQYPTLEQTGSGLQSDTEVFKAWLKTATPTDQTVDASTTWGQVSDTAWKNTLSYTVFSGQIKKELNTSEFWDPSLLDTANEFDKAGTIAAAKDWTGSK